MDVEDSITINAEYASKYDKKKRVEELSKLRDKYGDVGLEESESSSSDEEDEDAEMLTAAVEKDFLRTLSLIRSKDPRIYDKDTRFYHKELDRGPERKRNKEEKPMYLKDYERKQLLERGVMAGVSDSEEEEARNSREPATYLEEQEQLKADFHRAVGEGEDADEGDSLLTPRKKDKEELEEAERDYVLWLKGEKEKMAAGESDFVGLRSIWTAPDIDSGEAFLRDYILNRHFIDRDGLRPRVPTYEDVVGNSEEEGEGEVDVSEDEASLERQDDFERRHNFRFEEPGGDQIVTYPRTVSGSVRREDDRRKEKRKLREEKREKEREQKKEELKRLKKLKRKEIKQKLEKIKSITGNPNVGFSVADLDEDFDPTSYDEAMERTFDNDYYDMEEEGGDEEEGGEDGKPVFSDDDEEYGGWDDWQVAEEPHCEDPEFNMDADYDPDVVPEQDSSSSKKKSKLLKHRHKLAQTVSTRKPRFDPEEKSFEDYFDEYYNLDYEDMIGDMPCRFKYRQVPANSFGLAVEEVLTCEDKELNQWVSLKKSVQIRTKEEEERDKRLYKKKARNFKKKYQILTSLKQSQEDQVEGGRKANRKTKRTASKDSDVASTEQASGGRKHHQKVGEETMKVEENGENSGVKSKRRSKPDKAAENADTAKKDVPISTSKRLKHRKKHKISNSASKKLSAARLKSYGL